jgi:hypothetical protein
MLDPARRTEPLARLYSLILLWSEESTSQANVWKDPVMAAQVKAEVEGSNDITLVGMVARYVVQDATSRALTDPDWWDFNALRSLAADLVRRAQALEPGNREWPDLLEGVKRLPVAPSPATTRSDITARETLRIGAKVAARMLQESSPPILPPEAKAIRLQGAVPLQVRIGTDGHVEEMTLINGHPLLAGAAMDAAKCYMYKPFSVNGRAVEVVTVVEIPVK